MGPLPWWAGYVAAVMTEAGYDFFLSAAAGAAAAGIFGGIAEMTVYRPLYRKGELGAGVADHRAHVRGHRGADAGVRRQLQDRENAGLAGKSDRHRLPALSVVSAVPDRGRAGDGVPARLARDRPLALRRAAAGRGRQSAHGARGRHQREPAVHRHLHRRLRAGRLRRRDRRRACCRSSRSIRCAISCCSYRGDRGGEPGSFKGSFVAAIALGVVDTAGKFLIPEVAAFLLFRARTRCSCCGGRTACCRRSRWHERRADTTALGAMREAAAVGLVGR